MIIELTLLAYLAFHTTRKAVTPVLAISFKPYGRSNSINASTFPAYLLLAQLWNPSQHLLQRLETVQLNCIILLLLLMLLLISASSLAIIASSVISDTFKTSICL